MTKRTYHEELQAAVDEYALLENFLSLMLMSMGALSHIRSEAAAAINYTHPSMTRASIAEGDQALGQAMSSISDALALIKSAHRADVEALPDGVSAGRPDPRRLKEWAKRIVDRMDEFKDGEFGR